MKNKKSTQSSTEKKRSKKGDEMLTTTKNCNHTPNNNPKHTKLKPLGKVLLASAFALSALSITNAQPEAQNEAQAPANTQEATKEATQEATQEATNQSAQEAASEATNETSQAQTPNQKEPVQSISTPCGEGCGVPHTHTQESADTLGTGEDTQEQLAQEEQTRPFEIEPMNKEKSGVFVGLSIGVASLSYNGAVSYLATPTGGAQNTYTSSASLDRATGIYGILVGYKHAITGGFGLRYYADFNYSYAHQNKIWGMNYNLNIDGLLNIVEKNNNFFGFFAGVGLGAQSYGWSNKLLENMLEEAGKVAEKGGLTLAPTTLPKNYKGKKFSNPKTSFNVAINFGVRANLAKHHDVELGVRFRPVRATLGKPDKMESKPANGGGNGNGETTKVGTKAVVGSNYDIFFRYNFVF